MIHNRFLGASLVALVGLSSIGCGGPKIAYEKATGWRIKAFMVSGVVVLDGATGRAYYLGDDKLVSTNTYRVEKGTYSFDPAKNEGSVDWGGGVRLEFSVNTPSGAEKTVSGTWFEADGNNYACKFGEATRKEMDETLSMSSGLTGALGKFIQSTK